MNFEKIEGYLAHLYTNKKLLDSFLANPIEESKAFGLDDMEAHAMKQMNPVELRFNNMLICKKLKNLKKLKNQGKILR